MQLLILILLPVLLVGGQEGRTGHAPARQLTNPDRKVGMEGDVNAVGNCAIPQMLTNYCNCQVTSSYT